MTFVGEPVRLKQNSTGDVEEVGVLVASERRGPTDRFNLSVARGSDFFSFDYVDRFRASLWWFCVQNLYYTCAIEDPSVSDFYWGSQFRCIAGPRTYIDTRSVSQPQSHAIHCGRLRCAPASAQMAAPAGPSLELLGLDLIDEWLPSDLGRLRSYLEPVA